MMRVERDARNQPWHDADIAVLIRSRMVDGDLDVDIEAAPPCFELSSIKNIARATRAVEQDNSPVRLAPGKHAIYCGTQWCEAEPTGDEHNIAALGLRDGPAGAIRAPHSDDRISPQPRVARR